MDQHSDQTTAADNRRNESRIDMAERVAISLDGGTILGPGQNISAQGLYFLTEGAIPVTVRIGGVEQPVRGELVRVTAMGDGRLGIAVRFVDPGSVPV